MFRLPSVRVPRRCLTALLLTAAQVAGCSRAPSQQDAVSEYAGAVDRDDAAAVRPPDTHPAGPPGFLSREQIQGVVRLHLSAITRCYELELATDPELTGMLKTQWMIGLDGAVQLARIIETDMDNAALESCILSELVRMQFDHPNGGVVLVTYPFHFRSE